jgi:predicted DNA-binding transcriptional regulator YafY
MSPGAFDLVGARTQFNRVIFILEAIQSGRYPTAGEMAAEYEVSERTIRRDIEWLKDFHDAPIVFDRRHNGFALTDSTYRLPALTISEGELLAITVGEQVLASYRNSPWHEPISHAFARIEALLPESVTLSAQLFSRKVSVITPPVTAIEPAVWDEILAAARGGRIVEIAYHGAGYERPARRRFHPYRLVGHDGSWYAIGWSEHHEAVRVFSLSRIRSARIQPEPFQIPESFDAGDYIDPEFGVYNRSSEGPQEVRVVFDADVAHLVRERRWHSSQRLIERPDGGVELCLTTNQTDQVLFRVMSFGPSAEIVAPVALRDRAAEWTRQLASRYGQP